MYRAGKTENYTRHGNLCVKITTDCLHFTFFLLFCSADLRLGQPWAASDKWLCKYKSGLANQLTLIALLYMWRKLRATWGGNTTQCQYEKALAVGKIIYLYKIDYNIMYSINTISIIQCIDTLYTVQGQQGVTMDRSYLLKPYLLTT